VNFQSDLYVAHLLKPHQVSLHARSQCHPLMTGGQPHLWFSKLVLPLFSVKSFSNWYARFARFLICFGENIVNQKFICLILDAAMHSFLLPMAKLNRMNELLVYSQQTGTLFLGKSLGPLGIGKIAFVVPNKYSLDFFFYWTISPLLRSHCKGFIVLFHYFMHAGLHESCFGLTDLMSPLQLLLLLNLNSI